MDDIIENIEYMHQKIKNWKYIEMKNEYGNEDHIRFYYFPLYLDKKFSSFNDEKVGFYFYVIGWVSGVIGEVATWDCIIKGTTTFDGLRHLYLGDDGYLNYPNISILISIFEELKKLEKKYCNEVYLLNDNK